jgi:transglutaminase-like putative cysteine protease
MGTDLQDGTAADAKAGAAGAALLVEHETQYQYSTQVAFAHHLAYLHPLDAPGQAVRDFALDIDPPPAGLSHGRDVFGNRRTYFSLTRPHETLCVRARCRVTLEPRFERLDTAQSAGWEAASRELRFVAGAPFEPASEFCFDSPLVPRGRVLREYGRASFPAGATVLAGALDLMHRIHRDFRYDAASTDVGTTVLEAFEARAGVCQDFSHVMIACLRSLGLAARYVSGYLHTQARFKDQEPGAQTVIGADASHAWVAVYCPRQGWVEFDPTNDAVPGTGHVRLASGRDYADVAPLRGVVQGGGDHRLRVAVRIAAA